LKAQVKSVERKKYSTLTTSPVAISPPQLRQKQIVINTFNTEYPLIDEVAVNEMGWRVSKEQDWTKGEFDLWWSDLGVDGNFFSQLKSFQKVNHFPAMFNIARKTFLAKNLKRL